MFNPANTQVLEPNLYAIRTRYVNMFVFTHEAGAVAFDAGMSIAAVRRGFKELDLDPGSVRHVFLTHSDNDHTGGLALFTQAQVYLSAAEVPLIDGTTARGFLYHNRRPKRPYTALRDGETVDAGRHRIHALAAPGHTPGSMAYLLDESILFTGDTIQLRSGQALPGLKSMAMDYGGLQASAAALIKLEGISLLCTGHTGIARPPFQTEDSCSKA